MVFSLAQVFQWLLIYRYFILFPIVVIEGPIITIIAGFLVSLGYFNFFIAYGVVAVGDLAGDSIYYALGRWGREKFITKWGHYIGITLERVKTLESHFQKHSGKTLLLGKITHGIGSVFLLAAGIAKMPYKKFFLFNLAATLPKSFLLLLVGYYFGRAYVELNKYLNYAAFIIAGSVILLIVIYFIIVRKRNNKKYAL